MAVKIRLARHGKKGAPFYHIVAADSRAPRDGKLSRNWVLTTLPRILLQLI